MSEHDVRPLQLHLDNDEEPVQAMGQQQKGSLLIGGAHGAVPKAHSPQPVTRPAPVPEPPSAA